MADRQGHQYPPRSRDTHHHPCTTTDAKTRAPPGLRTRRTTPQTPKRPNAQRAKKREMRPGVTSSSLRCCAVLSLSLVSFPSAWRQLPFCHPGHSNSRQRISFATHPAKVYKQRQLIVGCCALSLSGLVRLFPFPSLSFPSHSRAPLLRIYIFLDYRVTVYTV